MCENYYKSFKYSLGGVFLSSFFRFLFTSLSLYSHLFLLNTFKINIVHAKSFNFHWTNGSSVWMKFSAEF